MDDYIKKVIGKGDIASKIIHDICRETYRFRPEVQEIDSSVGGLTVIRPPKDRKIVIHSFGGNIKLKNNEEYAKSLVDILVSHSKQFNAEPIAMTNTLDMSDINIDVVKEAATGLYKGASEHGVAIINGEIAGLGDRVGAPFNISGTMISFMDMHGPNECCKKNGINYTVFKHEDKPLFANSDGVGTKIEIAERTGNHTNMHDGFGMLADDTIKFFGLIKALSTFLEKSNKGVPEDYLTSEGKRLARQMGFKFTLQPEIVGDRVRGYGDSPYYLGGTCVSVIDENLLENMPLPKAGEYLIVIRDPQNPNFRSNGITKVRNGLKEIFGEEWHTATFQGENVGKLAGAPSTIFYPIFKELFEKNLASGFYHMSGGSHKGKLAKPLAKHGLGAEISNLFEPPNLMKKLMLHYKMTFDTAYEIWNMGNEGYVATSNPDQVINVLEKHGLEGRVSGELIQEPKLTIKIPAWGGSVVYK